MDALNKVRAQWDRSSAIGCTVAGAVVLVLGWFGVSSTPYPAEQLPYIVSAGLGGLFLLGVASVLWLSADLRDEWRKLDAIERAIVESETGGDAGNSAHRSGHDNHYGAENDEAATSGTLR